MSSSSSAEQVTLFCIEFHSPVPGQNLKDLVFWRVDRSIEKTVICEQSYLWTDPFREIINVAEEEQWAEYSALWNSGSNINLSGLLPLDDYTHFPLCQEAGNPFECRLSDTICIKFVKELLMRHCTKRFAGIQNRGVDLSVLVIVVQEIICCDNQLCFTRVSRTKAMV